MPKGSRTVSTKREWTIEETGALIAELELLRTPAEIAAALARDEEDVQAKMAALALSYPSPSRKAANAKRRH